MAYEDMNNDEISDKVDELLRQNRAAIQKLQ